jgi:hypothetical protein
MMQVATVDTPAPPTIIEPALVLQGRRVAAELGVWVLHLARTCPRLADVIGYVRIMSLQVHETSGPVARQAWTRCASWLEQLDRATYPAQLAAVIDGMGRPKWRGPHSPKPWLSARDATQARNARPLPTCSSCDGLGSS